MIILAILNMKNSDRLKSSFLIVVVFLLGSLISGFSQNTKQTLSQSRVIELKRIGVMIGQGKPDREVQEAWKTVLNIHKDIDIETAIGSILAEAKQEGQRNVDSAKKRVQFYSLLKNQLTTEITNARNHLSEMDKTKTTGTLKRKIFNLKPGIKGEIVTLESGSLSGRNDITRYAGQLEEQLNTVGDDAQLANVDLQNVLQKQQQTLQMLSNISKMLSDTAMAVIRKIGG